MKIKVSKRKAIAFIVAFILIINILLCATVPTHAMSLPANNTVTSGKLIDMCLTRSGKVVNSDIREDVLNQTRNVLNDTATSYRQWCTDNGKSKSVETFREYLESDAYASLPFRLAKYPLELASFIEWLINGETLLDVIGTDVNEVLTESDDLGNVTVPSETVNIINQCFESVKGTYTNGWFYVPIRNSNELSSGYFDNYEAYNDVKNYINSNDNETLIIFEHNSYVAHVGYNHTSTAVFDNTKSLNIVFSASGGQAYLTYYTDNWSVYNPFVRIVNKTITNFPYVNSEEFVLDCATTTSNLSDTCKKFIVSSDFDTGVNKSFQHAKMFFFGKENGYKIIYRSLQAMKDYSLGNTPYYLTNRQYSDSVDNSFNVSGEYIQNNGGTFAYEQIREQINNSNVTNDSSVSNIVNDYSQTIINNYNYSSGTGDGGNGGNGDSGGNSILDGLGSIISAITEIIGFLLSVIGDVISLISTGLTTVFDLIKGLGGVFASFSGLLGELFTFIPSEFIELLTASMSVMVILAVWKKFTK